MQCARRGFPQLRLHTLVCLLGLMICLPTAAAPANPAALASASEWLRVYGQLAAHAPAHCLPVTIPSLSPDTPALAFPLHSLVQTATTKDAIVYSQDTLAERLVVLAEDAEGCVHAGESGRDLPFDSRSVRSPLPNTLIPVRLGDTPPVAILSDSKAILPWLRVMDADDFVNLSAQLWWLLGAYTGMLSILLLVGIGISLWGRSTLALAYVAYICALQFYQLDISGVGVAWLPFWSDETQARLMHVLSLAVIVPGIATIIVAFLEPRGWTKRVVLGGFAVSTLAFLCSYWDERAYRLGVTALALMMGLMLVLLISRLRSGRPGVRWFAAGTAVMLIAGGSQAAAVLTQGTEITGATALLVPLGTLAESCFWLIGIATQLRAERLDMLSQLQRDATQDPLTGIHNRSYLRAEIRTMLHLLRTDPGHHFGLLFVDLDGFKRVNDSLGHAMGDRVLKAVVKALQELDLGSRALGRYGGDEFVILLEQRRHWSMTIGAASAIAERFKEPLLVGDMRVPVSASVGVVAISDAHANVDQIVADADTALHVAKRAGGGRYQIFEATMRTEAEHRADLRLDLGAALSQDQIEVHFQPIFDLASLRPVGFEALARWRHPRDGLLTAAQFLPLAEETGLAAQIAERVIEEVFAQISQWQSANLWRHGEYVSINVCSQQLIDEVIVDQLSQAFGRWPVDPASIRLELAESLLTTHLDLARRVLPRLTGLGILCGVDDFGTGTSALTTISQLDPCMIKIDPSVIEGILGLVQSQNLARGILALGNEMGALIIAEGIETEEQQTMLHSLGCPYGQGTRLAPPMAGSEVAAWVALWQESIPHTVEPRTTKQIH